MSIDRISLDEIYSNDKCDGSVFHAVKMMSEEARFINEQYMMGNVSLSKKPTTIAMMKFKEGRLDSTTIEDDVELEEMEEIVEIEEIIEE
jgi:hypothetical protein